LNPLLDLKKPNFKLTLYLFTVKIKTNIFSEIGDFHYTFIHTLIAYMHNCFNGKFPGDIGLASEEFRVAP